MWEEEKKKENDVGRKKHLHSWEEFANSEEVAQDIHVDLQYYFTFELLFFCTFILWTLAQLLEKETGLRKWNTFLGVFKKTDDSPFFPNWSSRTHKNPEQINQIAFKILET